MMEGPDGRPTRPNNRVATTQSLVDFTTRSLDESAEKQRATLNGADLPPGWGPSAGDTLDLSSKGAKELPVEVIELIKDRVER